MSIRRDYFDWLCYQISDGFDTVPYKSLLSHLHSTDFFYVLKQDYNRVLDGIDLRHRFFSQEYGYIVYEEVDELDRGDTCSVLELMVALAIRGEETMMDNDSYGDRTGQWFWNMVLSLGLEHMTDENYDKDYVDNVLSIFMNRLYAPNGAGGLFTIEDSGQDVSKVEIWYQFNWYLTDFVDKLEV